MEKDKKHHDINPSELAEKLIKEAYDLDEVIRHLDDFPVRTVDEVLSEGLF